MEGRLEDDPPPAVERERTGPVLGVAFGLGVLMVCVLVVAGVTLLQRSFDGAGVLDEILPERPLPFGLELVEASLLPTGERILRLAAAEEVNVAEGEEPLPDEVILAVYSNAGEVTRLFEGGDDDRREDGERMVEWQEDPSFDWHTEMGRGEIAWRGWRATFVRERAFEEGGTWSESMRVNLSQGGRYLVLFAHWPRDVTASEDRLRELLTHVALKEEEKEERGG